MIAFTVVPPQDVPLIKGQINCDALCEFWRKSRGLGEKSGCYIFAVPRTRGADGIVPIYVGKSTQPFSDECFTPEKLLKLGEYLRHHSVPKLTLFLVVHPPNRGGVNSQAIGELETQLIRRAFKVNPKLLNKHNAHEDTWIVRGVLPSSQGKRSRDAIQLRALLGIDKADKTINKSSVPEPAAVQNVQVETNNQPA